MPATLPRHHRHLPPGDRSESPPALATAAAPGVEQVLDAQGKAGSQSPKNRWTVQTRVSNTGIGLPYNISVQVTYARGGQRHTTTATLSAAAGG